MLLLTIANERQRRQLQHPGGPLELGRGPQRELPREVIEDRYTSRDQLVVEELDDGNVRVVNLGGPVTLPDGTQLASGEFRTIMPPVRLLFGHTTIDLGVIPDDDGDHGSALQSLSRPLRASTARAVVKQLSDLGESPTAETLAQWFETLLSVQRAAAGTDKFYAETARAVVDLVGLDRGMVLLKTGEQWDTVAQHSLSQERASPVSRRVLHQVCTERRTYFQNFQAQSQDLWQSIMGVEAVVASPIFDEHDAVIGAVYGSRDMRSGAGMKGIQPLEAQFVQLLAGAVSAGLARLEREKDAARARVQFEQFFSPELAGALERDAGILGAQERELTLLFADLRGFSRISERIGASETYHLLSDILDRLTNQVMDHGGVVIDYYGDGLAAMWNAPADQPDHAALAARAALAMQTELPAINAAWAERLGGEIRIGIGLNTGLSQVGNAGSKRRLKYGPRGHAVNLASRIEGATKVLGVSCLVTEATQKLLPAEFVTHRLCRARVTGMDQPIALYELAASAPASATADQRDLYAQALLRYEQDIPAECLALCQQRASQGPTDRPWQLLTQYAQTRLSQLSAPFDPIFSLETKQ